MSYAEKEVEARKKVILCVSSCPEDSFSPCENAENLAGGQCHPYCLTKLPYQISEVNLPDRANDGCPEALYATYESEFLRRCLTNSGILGASLSLFDSSGNETQALDFLSSFFNA